MVEEPYDEESVDDVLETERPGKLQHAVGREALPEDNDSPAAQAYSLGSPPIDHPSQDTNIDSDEKYQEG